jgi:hypothetical protein
MKLEMNRGDSAVFDIECSQADGSPLDITTGLLFFTAKSTARQTDVDAIFQKTSEDGISVVSGPAGTATITLEPEDTESAYAPQWYKWDLQFVTTGGQPATLASGDLLLRPDVTRSIA